MIKLLFLTYLVFYSAQSPRLAQKSPVAAKNEGTLKITFVNVVKKDPMVLGGVKYVNAFNETYTIGKYKYYVSNVVLRSAVQSFSETNSYHLIDQNDPASLSFSFPVPAGSYHAFSFLLGVDSQHNVSGAQTGALDPVNDMFWTWNSGYVMAKMEGTSPASPLNNIFQYHIGGFAGANTVLQKIRFPLMEQKKLKVQANSISEIIIVSDANEWWQRPYSISISANPNITTMGLPAKKISDNYSKMFRIKKVINTQ